MRFVETAVRGAMVVEPEPRGDERGFFARTFCELEFAERGLEPCVAQCSISWNERAGTLRGLHYRVDPPEAKLVRCTRGRVFDVVADVRPGSSSLGRWAGVELTEGNRRAMYVPPGCAHGFMTLDDGCEVLYQMSHGHVQGVERGVRWNDPALAIEWPVAPRLVSARDRGFPLL